MKFIITIVFFVFSTLSFSQQKYWIFFKDKKETTFNPYTYFDAKAIERRIVNEIPICDSTDYPINDFYKKSIQNIACEVSGETRWFNAVSAVVSDEQINEIKNLNFVRSVELISSKCELASHGFEPALSPKYKDLLVKQTESMEGSLFAKNNISGKKIRIAIFDGGFPWVDTNPVFDHIRKNNRIIKTFDFVKKRDFVYDYNSHGTMVLSCIAGLVNGMNVGLATDAEFLLARTEENSEPFSEEENWLAAVEWADKNGAQIINSSLGYTNERYFNEDMNGKKTLVTRAANLAARKGILVVNANGNDGSSSWKYIGAPADADSIISVGGIDPDTEYHISFSSFGPTADKRMKPNVSAYGTAIAAGKKYMEMVDGTSFASPLVAGFAACALQMNPGIKAMELFIKIQESGNLYPFYDYAHGYGIPQASYFVDKEKKIVQPSFEFSKDQAWIYVTIKDSLLVTPYKMHNYIYYHIENNKGFLDKYAVINVYSKDALKIPLQQLKNGEKLRVHYMGYTAEFTIE